MKIISLFLFLASIGNFSPGTRCQHTYWKHVYKEEFGLDKIHLFPNIKEGIPDRCFKCVKGIASAGYSLARWLFCW